MKLRRCLRLLLAMTMAWPVAAHAALADPGGLVLVATERFVLPAYSSLHAAADDQAKVWERFCRQRTPGGLATLKGAFNATADAWTQVDFVRLGPATTAMRTERFNYWIDRTGASGKVLSALLAGSDESSLSPSAIGQLSAAGQGLPILERLLFDEGGADKLMATTSDGARRCAVGVAVANNLASMSADLAAGWSGPGGVVAALKEDKPWGVYFANRREAASVLLTDLVIGLEGLKDNEAAMLFHDEANPAAVRLAEQWRSGRSLRDAHLKYAALERALQPFLAGADEKTAAQLRAAFKDTNVKFAAAAAALADAPPHSAARTAALQEVMGSLGALIETVMPAAPTASGVPLGFNSLDGD